MLVLRLASQLCDLLSVEPIQSSSVEQIQRCGPSDAVGVDGIDLWSLKYVMQVLELVVVIVGIVALMAIGIGMTTLCQAAMTGKSWVDPRLGTACLLLGVGLIVVAAVAVFE